jgi:hypothetical protein
MQTQLVLGMDLVTLKVIAIIFLFILNCKVGVDRQPLWHLGSNEPNVLSCLLLKGSLIYDFPLIFGLY